MLTRSAKFRLDSLLDDLASDSLSHSDNEHKSNDAPPSLSDLEKSARLSFTDANSIVGGEAIPSYNVKDPTVSGPKDLSQNEFTVAGDEKDDFAHEAEKSRVFSFSLPFGGLSAVGSSLYRLLLSFKLDAMNLMSSNLQNESTAAKETIRVKLERQESIETLEDAAYFKKVKSLEGLRFKAVKHSITLNFNEILPEIKLGKREEFVPDTVFSELEGNIVIMGGYRGSVLRDSKTHKRVWIPLKAGLKLRKINLLLGPTHQDELDATRHIYPDGMLKNIGPIDISKRLIKKLGTNPRANVHEFGYDWRLSGLILAQQFSDFLQKLFDKTGKPSLVIAHSMGGLVAHGAMHLNPRLFRGIVYVGVPSECLNMLGPIRFGDSVMFSDKILRAETNFMMRSSFMFLPLSGRVFMNKDTKEHYDLDFFDPNVWVDYSLSPLVASARKQQEEEIHPSASNEGNRIALARLNIASRIRSFTNHLDFSAMTRSPLSSPRSDSFSFGSPNDESLDTECTISFSQAYEYLTSTLRETKEYVLSLDRRPDMALQYPPMAIVYGNEIPSVRGSLVSSKKDIRDGNYYEFYYGHGDGVVHQKWLMPERKGFEYYNADTGKGEIVGKFPSPCGHVSLLTDLKAMLSAIKAILDAEKMWEAKQEKQRDQIQNANS